MPVDMPGLMPVDDAIGILERLVGAFASERDKAITNAGRSTGKTRWLHEGRHGGMWDAYRVACMELQRLRAEKEKYEGQTYEWRPKSTTNS